MAVGFVRINFLVPVGVNIGWRVCPWCEYEESAEKQKADG